MGNWKDYDQLTALNDQKDLLVAGLGADYSEGVGFNSLCVTPDIQYASPSGLFIYGSYFARYTNHNPVSPTVLRSPPALEPPACRDRIPTNGPGLVRSLT